MRVAIVGQGYVGQAIGSAASKAGHQVIGIENNQKRIGELANIGYPVTNDDAKVADCEIIILAVPTPLKDNREPDLSFIESACNSIKPHVSNNSLIINESTSYPGTLRNLIEPLLGSQFLFASAPERVDPANEKWDVTNTPRLIGGLTETATKKAIEFYQSIAKEIIEVSSPEVAEAAKLFENTFRQVNIALVNEFAKITNILNISTYETLNAANTKPFGFMRFLPSVGVGGHCIPIDPIYLSFIADQHGVDAHFIKHANEINKSMANFIADKIEKEYSIKGKSFQIAGISYKSNVADIRESPALELMEILRLRGGHVIWHDELVGSVMNEKTSPIQKVDLGIICAFHEGVDYSEWTASSTPVIDLSTDGAGIGKKYL